MVHRCVKWVFEIFRWLDKPALSINRLFYPLKILKLLTLKQLNWLESAVISDICLQHVFSLPCFASPANLIWARFFVCFCFHFFGQVSWSTDWSRITGPPAFPNARVRGIHGWRRGKGRSQSRQGVNESGAGSCSRREVRVPLRFGRFDKRGLGYLVLQAIVRVEQTWTILRQGLRIFKLLCNHVGRCPNT